MSFKEWMSEVNDLVEGTLGLSALDLPDFNYRDYFDSDISPEIVVNDLIEELEIW